MTDVDNQTDDPLKLTDDEVKQIWAWLGSKADDPDRIGVCLFCRQHTVEVAEYLVILESACEYPAVQFLCANCGYTQLVNAVIAGLA